MNSQQSQHSRPEPSPDLLAPLDLAFWNIETAEHPMHLGALGVFAATSPGDARHAVELLAARAPAVPGLRMRIQGVRIPVGGAARVPVPDFDPLDHVRLNEPTADFHAAAGALMERPLDRARPRGRHMSCRGRTAPRSPSCSSSTTRWPTGCGR